ncbi:MAG: hypothetical protein QOJ99_2187 [Bryobacterales bacterium]|jgi:hypothetical protein|nr:hypothetical protein [Bryobacterales bacterium]
MVITSKGFGLEIELAAKVRKSDALVRNAGALRKRFSTREHASPNTIPTDTLTYKADNVDS